MSKKLERYIGDGVYASFDGFQIWLRTQRGDGWDEIALEPESLAALNDFIKEVGDWLRS